MNTMTDVPAKRQEDLLDASEKGCPPVRTWHHAWRLVMVALALALGCLGLVQLATAHSGLDPEIEEITEKLTKDPDNVDLLILRGQVYRSNGKFLESLQDLERAWLLDRENRTVALHRALTLSALGRYQEAEAALDKLLQKESDPKRVFSLAERAHIRAQTGRVDLAIADYTAALQLHPTIELYLIRGQLQESLGQFEVAAAGYQDGLAKLGDAILLKKGLIRVQLAQKHFSEALTLINEEVARSSVKTSWYVQRAELLGLMGQPDAARLAYEQALSEANRALRKRPTAMHLLARAEIYHAMGRMEEATQDLRAAVKKAPHFAKATHLLKQLESR